MVADALRQAWPHLQITITVYTTRGDRDLGTPLPQIGGKGLFTSEIEAALRNHEIDLAVHSYKDLPIADSPDLIIGAVPQRADPRDTLVSRHNLALENLPPAPHIGTSSPRRAAQLRNARPDAHIADLRGNLDTRLRKATTPDYDAVILAAAGLFRMGWETRVTQFLPFDLMLPAPAQGALAVQCRARDAAVLALLHPIHDELTAACVAAERAFLNGLGGGCSAPVGACAEPVEGENDNRPVLLLHGLVASPDGQTVIRVQDSADLTQAENLGLELPRQALQKGGQQIMETHQ
jgi:hydroxymethylbilane synthase